MLQNCDNYTVRLLDGVPIPGEGEGLLQASSGLVLFEFLEISSTMCWVLSLAVYWGW